MAPLNEESALRRGLYLHNTQHIKETDIYVPAGFEPAILGRERPQTDTLDRAATEIGIYI
jgi:hypothetical protein